MIIFINGSINSGKSTVAKILAAKLGETAVLEVDFLREMISWLPLEQAIPINLENAVAIIKVLAKRNINVVIPYPLSKDNLEYLLENLKEYEEAISIFTLSPELEVALTNRGGREISDEEKARIKYHYAIGIPNPGIGIVVDNSEQTPEQTAAIIFNHVL
jgi:cytidylate kinase